jgi:hypothetical protein
MQRPGQVLQFNTRCHDVGVANCVTTMWGCKTSPHFRLIVTVPNGGEVWSTGRSQTIRWSSSGISGGVKIEISRDGGMSWSTLNYKTSNDGAQKWSVKGPATTPGANPDLQFACSDHLWHQQR